MYISFTDIGLEQSKPLSYKIDNAKDIIQRGFDGCCSRASLAFSGGKDSTVLWHLIKSYFPEQAKNMAVIFGNTLNEFPESLKFARELGKAWAGDNFYEVKPEALKYDSLKYEAQVEVLEWLIETGKLFKVLKKNGRLKSTRTLEKMATADMWEDFSRRGLVWKAGTRKNYWWCVDQYGWPILGKAASRLKAHRINIDCFLNFGETESTDESLIRYYEMLENVKISQGCCDVLKKEPSKKAQRELKADLIFLGLMASESFRRKRTFSNKGPLFEVVTESRMVGLPVYNCHPLAIWTDDDIWEYIHCNNVPYSPLYDLTYVDSFGNTRTIKRNGCMGCCTDYGRKNSHMYAMRQTHPKAWEVVMKRGMAAEIQKLRTDGGEKYRPSKKDYERLAPLDVLAVMAEDGADYDEKLAWAIENRPCAFD